MLGRRVQWESAGAVQEGIAERIDDDGALIVKAEGRPVRVISGEEEASLTFTGALTRTPAA